MDKLEEHYLNHYKKNKKDKFLNNYFSLKPENNLFKILKPYKWKEEKKSVKFMLKWDKSKIKLYNLKNNIKKTIANTWKHWIKKFINQKLKQQI